jgi:protease PrsW
MRLLIVSLAPVFIIAVYIYLRDKYEKEPIGLLLKTILLGSFIVLPILIVEKFLDKIQPELPGHFPALYQAFFVAGFTEEFFKFLVIFLLIWKNKNFSEKFDGIVYAVFVSLGFAGIENILYVIQHGENVAYIRAITAVPAHAIFGITMGFYFGLAKFYRKNRLTFLFKAFLFPVILHGIYDFILMSRDYRLMWLFIPFMVFLYFDGFRKINKLSVYRR